MKELIVRAAKCFSVGILVIATLPVFIPLLFLFSFLGFAFVLPLGCALAGFIYLRKHVEMLYWKLPSPAGSWGVSAVPSGPASCSDADFTGYSLKDLQPIEMFEEEDIEFDAVVVSTTPSKAQEFEDAVYPTDGTKAGPVPISDTSTDDGHREERKYDAQQPRDEKSGRHPVAGWLADESADASICCSYASAVDKVQRQEEEKPKQQFEGNTNYDFPSLPSAETDERSFETREGREKTPVVSENEELGKEDEFKAHPADDLHVELYEEQEREDRSPTPELREALERTKEAENEVLPDDVAPLAVDGCQEREDVPWIPAAKASLASDGSPEEEASTKPDADEIERSSHLLPHQLTEDDIWICKECGWKYPNAKPSAKIRRNHKKHCKGPAFGGELPTAPSQLDNVVSDSNRSPEIRTDLKSMSPTDSFVEQFREGSTGDEGPTSNAESDAQGIQSRRPRTADEPMTGGSVEGMDSETVAPALGSCFSDNLHYEGGQDVPGFQRCHPSLSSTVEDSRLLSKSPRPQDEESFRVEHVSKSVTSNDAAMSSARFEDEQGSGSPVSIKSFRSAPDEFPDGGALWSSFASVESNFDDEQDCLAQVEQELQLSYDLTAMKGIVGDEHASAGPLLTDIEELSEFLGIDLPARSVDVPVIEWAKVAIEVMKVVVGVD